MAESLYERASHPHTTLFFFLSGVLIYWFLLLYMYNMSYVGMIPFPSLWLEYCFTSVAVLTCFLSLPTVILRFLSVYVYIAYFPPYPIVVYLPSRLAFL